MSDAVSELAMVYLHRFIQGVSTGMVIARLERRKLSRQQQLKEQVTEPVILRRAQTMPGVLPVVETFHSIQGEGRWSGYSAFFIRLAGCNVGCPWCDTKESWPQDRHPQRSIADLVAAALAVRPRMVVITGGEPLMHDLTELTQAIADAGLRVHLETSGAYLLSGRFDWITLSPKRTLPPDPSLYDQADELKVIIADTSDLAWAEEQAKWVAPQVIKLLQPEWTVSQAKSAALVCQYVLNHPEWQVSLQTHKYLGIH